MKIIKQGIIETSQCTCPRCHAELEYSTKDIIGSGKLTQINTGDWVDAPIIQSTWPKYVKKIITKYNNEYVATGYFAKREGYIECPCCGNHITFDKFPVQIAVYPEESINEDNDIVSPEIISVNSVVTLLKRHYDEFNKIVMNKYTIYCSEQQTKKALELGAPIELWSEYYKNQEHDFKLDTPIPCKHFTTGYCAASCPTAEQMIGWLVEQDGIEDITVCKTGMWIWGNNHTIIDSGSSYLSRQESNLAAIDAALDYLIEKKGE